MNKNEIKQIILEEIEAALQEMNKNMSPEELAAQSFIDDEELDDERASDIEGPGWEDMPGAKIHPFVGDQEARIARAMETGDEDELEDLAAGELDRAGLEEMARTANVFALAKKGDIKDVLQFMMRVNDVLKTYKSPGQKRPKKRFTREEMLALADKMTQPEGFTSKDIIAATSYSSPAQANKFLAALEQKGLIKLISQLKKSMTPERDPNAPETRGRKAKSAEFDVPDDALDMDFGDFEDLDLGDIGALEEASAMSPETDWIKDQNVRKLMKAIGFKPGSVSALKKAIADKKPQLLKYGLTADKLIKILNKAADDSRFAIDREFATANYGGFMQENNNTIINLEKYIRQQIKEAKNPLASKMKEIENQGRIAALETKLAAVAEMIDETNARLTRIDEDEEFTEMMDKNAVKGVRKQLKELERAKLKLEKEYAKISGGRKNEKVVDKGAPVAESNGDIPDIDWEDIDADIIDRPDYQEGTITGYSADGREWQAHGSYTEFDGFSVIDDIEEVPGRVNESILRMQKLAGLITESDIRKKLSLKENINPAVIGFLQKHVPEEAPGSWDDVNHEFVVPYNHEALDYSEDDVQDFLYDTGLTLADLPTEYVEIDNWSVEYRNRPATARNFAKYVPGKGLYYKTTTELA